jgi:transmembrane sensor
VSEPIEYPPDLTPIMREALAWVVRLRSGNALKSDLADAQLWRDQSPEHEQAFRQAARLWRDLKNTADAVAQERDEEAARQRSWHPAQWSTTRRAFVGAGIAASAAAYILYDPPMQLWPSLSELRADYRTAKGERRDVSVSDGVALTLGTQTSVAMLSSERSDPRLELIAGEASVTADRPKDHPLALQALEVRMVAARARFNARCIDGKVSVTCFDGSVDVETPRRLTQLQSGQQVNFSVGDGLSVPLPADLEIASAWQKGLLIVRNRPLSDVVNEVNRYRAGRIVIASPALSDRLVNGTFHIDHLDNFPNQVQQLFGAGVRVLPGGIILLV